METVREADGTERELTEEPAGQPVTPGNPTQEVPEEPAPNAQPVEPAQPAEPAGDPDPATDTPSESDDQDGSQDEVSEPETPSVRRV